MLVRLQLPLLLLLILAAADIAPAAVSRLETDFRAQSPKMRVLQGPTDEESCGGACLTVWSLGKELRKMEWVVYTSFGAIQREFYFSQGQPHLVIETSYTSNHEGRIDNQLKLKSRRRFWLHDRTAGPAGTRERKVLQEHARDLAIHFTAHRRQMTSIPPALPPLRSSTS